MHVLRRPSTRNCLSAILEFVNCSQWFTMFEKHDTCKKRIVYAGHYADATHDDRNSQGTTPTHLVPASKLPLRSMPALPYRVGEPVGLRAIGLAAASSSEEPRPRLEESRPRIRKDSVEETLGLLAVVGSVAFASARLRTWYHIIQLKVSARRPTAAGMSVESCVAQSM